MMNENDPVICSNCGKVLEEGTYDSIESRKPCPDCGSINRLIHFSAKANLSFGGSVELSGGVDIPTLHIQAVIIPGEKTNEGQLIEGVYEPWFDIIKLLEIDPSIAYQIDPRRWEEIIAGAYKKAGFEVTLTPRSGDHGRDVIATIKGIGTIRIIDDVKAHKPPYLVRATEVRALMGVLEGDRASKGFITTTTDFAPKIKDDPLIKPFLGNRIELVNGEMLLQRLKELSEKK